MSVKSDLIERFLKKKKTHRKIMLKKIDDHIPKIAFKTDLKVITP
jgi:hypothetical protein